MATLALTEQEGNVLIQLLDVAVKAQGLGVAENAIILTKKVQEAFKVDTTTPVLTETGELPEPEATLEPKDPNSNLSCGLDGGCESCQ